VGELHLALALGTALVLLLGLLAGFFDDRTILSQQQVALLAGILLGPAVLGVIDTDTWPQRDHIVEMAARITLAIGLMEVALRLPPGYPLRQWRTLVPLLAIAMPLMWLGTGLLVFALLGLPFWLALLAGAIVAATDPIAASGIVTSKTAEQHIPERIRHLLSAESGANDGLAYLLVFLPLLMLTRDTAEALSTWWTRILLWEVGFAALLGAAIGFGAARALRWAEGARLTSHDSILAYSVALSLFVVATAYAIGTNDIFCVFVAAATFNAAAGDDNRAQEEVAQVGVNQVLVLPMFALIGLMLPWNAWLDLGWKAPALVVLVMGLRRLPAILLLRPVVSPLRSWGDAVFYGWFGPIGIAAVFYAMLATRETGYEELWTITSLVLVASVVAHGMTATHASRAYGSYRRLRRGERD
jgi:NhaP-type Na+/H+ or K+/H+ antiporter